MGFEFLNFIRIDENEIHTFQPLAGSYAVLVCEGSYLLCYNPWRKQWELPAGKREPYETPNECAIRELYEETGQKAADLTFKGLMKVENTNTGDLKYNPVYFGTLKELQPFIENEETTGIKLWDMKEEIGYIDEVDLQLIMYLNQ